MKDVVVIAGPNGAGKTTASLDLLPRDLEIMEFVNADEIARGISPYNPAGSAIAAARLMMRRIRHLVATGQSFGFETTLSGKGYEKLLRDCSRDGYRINLIFLWLPSPAAAQRRVAKRVAQGGHDVPHDVIERRYFGGLRNLTKVYLPLADVGLVYDNSDESGGRLLASKADKILNIIDREGWRRLQDSYT